jgi:hypothetical protein
VPLAAIVGGVFEALLANEIVAEVLPLAFGAKITVKVALCPAVSVVGSDKPDRVNSELLEVAEETVTLDPLAVSVLVRFFVAPTVTFPKLRLAGLTASWPLAVPMPLSEIARVVLGAFDVTVTVPLADPAALGANCTVNVRLCPAVSCVGVVRPEIENPGPETVAWLKLTVVPPELVSVSDSVLLFPTCTLPNDKLLGFAVSAPGTLPTPLKGRLRLGFVASLVKATLPVAAPLLLGEKVTEKFTL